MGEKTARDSLCTMQDLKSSLRSEAEGQRFGVEASSRKLGGRRDDAISRDVLALARFSPVTTPLQS